MNNVVLVGRLTKDVDLRSTAGGTSVCTFTLAVDRRFKGKDGDKQADFIPVVAWRQLADLCSKYLSKGQQAAVRGSLQIRSYEDKNGNKRTIAEVVAEEVKFFDSGQKKERDNDYVPQFEDIEDDENLPF